MVNKITNTVIMLKEIAGKKGNAGSDTMIANCDSLYWIA